MISPGTTALAIDAKTHLSELTNVVDNAALGDLHFPAAITRGRLTIAVATDGVSPLVSRRIRERVDAEYGDEFAGLLDLLAEARDEARDRIAAWPVRAAFTNPGALDGLLRDVMDATPEAR